MQMYALINSRCHSNPSCLTNCVAVGEKVFCRIDHSHMLCMMMSFSGHSKACRDGHTEGPHIHTARDLLLWKTISCADCILIHDYSSQVAEAEVEEAPEL